MWFKSRETTTPTEQQPMPRDVETLEQVVAALDAGVRSELDAHRIIVETMVPALALCYGSVWLPDDSGSFALAVENGDMTRTMDASWPTGTTVRPGDGFGGEALRTKRPVLVDESSSTETCLRWATAKRAGARFGAFIPVIEDNRVVSLEEYYSTDELPFFGARTEKWEAISRLLTRARRSALAANAVQETLSDREAVTTVVAQVGAAKNETAALHTALDTVRAAFGWAYGSFWKLDEEAGVLRFAQESGSAGEEFRRVTLSASFAEGVGLSGRAWRADDLVFVQNLADLTDCVRAPAAQRAGVRSGVCFPISINGRLIGTMDFFVTETIDLSESRASTLRNVRQLVSQRIESLHRSEADADNARDLLDTVASLKDTTADAGHVAVEAVARAETMTQEVEALSLASTEIGDVIKIISGIADQTNLLSLNATIEAARAGDAGKGFAVVAAEVKDLAQATALATQKVAAQIAAIQASSESVSSGIHATSEIIGQLDSVQARIGEVLERQVEMARTFERS